MVAFTYLLAFLSVAQALPLFHLPTLPTLPTLNLSDLLKSAAKNDSDIVPGKYIVTLRPDMIAAQFNIHMNWVRDIHDKEVQKRADTKDVGKAIKAGVEKIWTENFQGYSGEFDEATIKKISASSQVYAVEPVRKIEINRNISQKPASWGLASISHRTTGWSQYDYDSSAGWKMWAYVIDTGVYTQHSEFQGRAFLGYNAYPGVTNVDRNGHGTHVAGTIIGKTYGVAKWGNVMAVKVFDTGSSTTDIVLDGYNWAVTNITNTPGRTGKSVISMSLAGGKSDAFNTAVNNAYKKGVLTIVAAGNSGDDAAKYSPASAVNAITVGAIDNNNNRASWSNYGNVVDIFAPGVNIQSAWIGSNGSTNILSGTSMATPHVAGLALYLKGKESGMWNAQTLTNRILNFSTKNKISTAGVGSPNRMAYNGFS